jgi:alpha-beta hydrolase superfamily lysophospholipase
LLKLSVLYFCIEGTDPSATAPAEEKYITAAGSANQALKLYPGEDHEIHNEFGKEEVFADVTNWLDGH